jgi:hypothetical protein
MYIDVYSRGQPGDWVNVINPITTQAIPNYVPLGYPRLAVGPPDAPSSRSMLHCDQRYGILQYRLNSR